MDRNGSDQNLVNIMNPLKIVQPSNPFNVFIGSSRKKMRNIFNDN